MIKSIWYEFDNWSGPLDELDNNSDVIFELEDGSKWSASFFTYPNIKTLQKKNQTTEECLSGCYFCATDMILISDLRKETILNVIQHLLLRNEVELYCTKLPELPEQENDSKNSYSVEESLSVWEDNAEFWDSSMGNESNRFHREVVRPRVSELLDPQAGDFILDIACGNGNYSAYLAEKGANVVAFDYSGKMVELAKRRQAKFTNKIEFCRLDATNERELQALKRSRPYTKAVSNMAVMDITDITKLFHCVNQLLAPNGIFVFATQHPCFVTLTEKYLTPHSYHDIAIEGQPRKQCYYHRSLQELFQLCFESGFVIDGFYEECFGVKEKPDVMVVRARKNIGFFQGELQND